MTDEVLETEDSLNLDEDQDSKNLDEDQDSNLDNDTTDNSNEELTKAQEIAKNQRIRAEKAEKELKALKAQPAKTETETPKKEIEGLSLRDVRALQDVHDDDVETITDWAKFKGITIAEAKKSPHIQTLLKTSQEERASAQVANTSTNKRSTNKLSDETLLEDFSKLKVPEDDEGIRKLAEAQMARKRAMLKN